MSAATGTLRAIGRALQQGARFGAQLSDAAVRVLHARGSRLVLRGSVLAGIAALLGAVAFIAWPIPDGLLDYRPVASVRVLDRNGGLLRELLSRADGRAVPLRVGQLPSHVEEAFIAAEDRTFRWHPGVSAPSIARAAWQNVRAGRVVSGGSTLTQQLARNLVPRPRTFLGKLQEALWALRLEAHLSKDEVLTQYLNRVPFGNNTFGVEAAAQLYFGRRAEHLSLAQAAVLASIPRGPSAYDPYRRMHRLRARSAWVLSRMVALGSVSPEDAERARTEPLDLQAVSASFHAPHFVTHVASNLDRWGLGEAVVIETTLDPELQREVEDIVLQEISRLTDRRVGSGAALVVDNASGEVLAYVGSADFFDPEQQGQNDGVQMKRQPGSALKPFLYVDAFRSGYTPATVIPDLEAHLPGATGTYAPKNYDRRLHGPVRIREALANSYNVPAVRIADALGPQRVLQTLRRAGFESLTQGAGFYGVGIVLGNGEVSLWEAARAYSGLARGGVVRPLRVLRRALRADGSELPIPAELKARRFADPVSTALVTDILADPSARASAFGLDNALRLPFPAAAKTGTSKGYSDNWTVGYTAERTVAVWAGNFDGTPMVQVSGITGAGPIFRRTLLKAMEAVAPAPLVTREGLTHTRICPVSGERAGPSCPAAMEERFRPGTEPTHDCAMHRAISASLPPDLAARCRALAGTSGRIVDLGPDYYEWARSEGLASEPWLAALCGERAQTDAGVRVLFPNDGADFVLFSDLPLEDQSIPVRLSARPGEGTLQLRLNGAPILSLQPPYTGRLQARKGQYVLTVHAADGRERARTAFRVRAEPSLAAQLGR